MGRLTLRCALASGALVLPLALAGGHAALADTPTPAPTEPPVSAADLVRDTGAATCTVAAKSARDSRGFSIGLGASLERVEEVGLQSDHTWEVRMSASEDFSLKGGLELEGVKGLGASFYGTLGSQYAATFNTTDGEEAQALIDFWNDYPDRPDEQAIAQISSQAESTYAGGDASIGGSLDVFGQEGTGAELSGQLGAEHFKNGYTDTILGFHAKADRLQVILGPAVPDDIDLGLTLEMLSNPLGLPVGITTRVTYTDVGDGSVQAAFTTPPAGGRLEKGVAVSLAVGSSDSGELGEVVGTLDLSDPTLDAQVVADAAKVAAELSNPTEAITAMKDLLSLLDQQSLATHRVYHVVRTGTGFAIGAELLADVEIDFTGDRTTTTLLKADNIDIDGSTTPYTPCTDALKIDLHPIDADVPGLGATMADWMAQHHADLKSADFVIDNPCPQGSQATCGGLFPVNYDREPPTGDRFEVVDPVQGPDCPQPFATEAEDAAAHSCRVGEMLIRLPHPVTVEEAVRLAKTQMPADVVGDDPVATQYSGNVACGTWHSATLGGLSSLADPNGEVTVAMFSGPLTLGGLFESLAGAGPVAPKWDPEDVTNVALIVSGRMSLC